jgi:hypothetical protein
VIAETLRHLPVVRSVHAEHRTLDERSIRTDTGSMVRLRCMFPVGKVGTPAKDRGGMWYRACPYEQRAYGLGHGGAV